MSISSSIFQKPCPACAVNVSVGADRCPCGHVFESSQNQSPQEAALRDEELYESYLSARVQQAQQAAHNAEQELADNPRDPEMTSAAELAREVARSIEADLDAQRHKIAALRRALPPKPVVLPPLPKIEVPMAPPKPVAVAPAPVIAPAPVVAAPVMAAAPPVKTIEMKTVVPAAPVAPAPAKAVQRASAAQKAAEVLAALKSAKAREAARRAREALEAEAKFAKQVAADPDILVQAAPRNVPPPAFRQDQAAKAEKVMETRKAVDGKECPNCTATVPLNTSRCHCGFAFVNGNTELPSLTLCTGDFTALRNSLNLNLRQ